MNPLETVLSRLVEYEPRERAPGKFMCKCPAHEDRTRSLAITERSDGALLLHCFAGCEVADICESIGLEITDLFPPRERSSNYGTPQRLTYSQGMEMLRDLRDWNTIIFMYCCDIRDGKDLAPPDIEQLRKLSGNLARLLMDMKIL